MIKHLIRSALQLLGVTALTAMAAPEESLWLEAEHLDGITGYCWPMARGTNAKLAVTNGNWGLSGPGWAAEWNQGGESGFLSIACGPKDDKAAATKMLEVPADGTYHVWVRYRDNREVSDRFQLKLEQPGAPAWTATYGEKPIVEEDNEAKLYWDGAFGWEGHDATLKKGPVMLTLLAAFPEPECRQLDCLVLTTDNAYRPLIKNRPRNYAWDLLAGYRTARPSAKDSVTRRLPDDDLPAAWQPKTFNNRGFVYLWNIKPVTSISTKDDKGAVVTKTVPADFLRAGETGRVLVPYNLPPKAEVLFRELYHDRADVPIFGDPRLVPTFHGVGPSILGVERDKTPGNEASRTASELFRKWLDANPGRPFAGMMNYHPDLPLSAEGKAAFFGTYKNRYVGNIAGESLGYCYPSQEQLKALDAQPDRRAVADTYGRIFLEVNTAKYKAVFGDDLAKTGNSYGYTIPCQSNEGIAYYNLSYLWGARTVGYESSVITSAMLGMRSAFLRGAARQHGGMTATYRSCNFGDSSTIFTGEQSMYTKPENIMDNFYSVFAGAGMTWYKFDIWYQFMAGVAMFYHEQGFDEFWTPGGTTAAGQWGLQLSPKGKLVDRFLRLTAKDFDRGAPYTPAAILVDYAHGWDPSANQPGRFGLTGPSPALKLGVHDQALQALFWTAFYPIGPESEKPLHALNENYVNGIWGDIFDVVYAYPDMAKWTTLDSYPVTFVGGDIAITKAEGERLVKYVKGGGTLVVADGQFNGPGAGELNLPKLGEVAESAGYTWMAETAASPSQRYRFRPIAEGKAQVLARTPEGQVLCTAQDLGKGRLIFLSIPYALGVDGQATPLLPRLFAQATAGLAPVTVEGDVEWSVNRNKSGWMVTLLNTRGQLKPQQGIFPTDYRENQTVTIRGRVGFKSARDRLLETDTFTVKDNAVTLTVPAGAVRIMELR